VGSKVHKRAPGSRLGVAKLGHAWEVLYLVYLVCMHGRCVAVHAWEVRGIVATTGTVSTVNTVSTVSTVSRVDHPLCTCRRPTCGSSLELMN
jgi:hypothetical protein